MNKKLFSYITENFMAGKTDLFAAFIEKCMSLTAYAGKTAMITQQGWMFLSSYQELRHKLFQKKLLSLVQLGARAFDEISGEVVQTCAFVTSNAGGRKYKTTFVRLVEYNGEKGKEIEFFNERNRFKCRVDAFNTIYGSPAAYWCSEHMFNIFEKNKPLSTILTPRQGVKTLDNNRFLKLWFEILYPTIGFDAKSLESANLMNKKWFPYNKGGTAIKWYGNKDYVVNWENDGAEMKALAVEKYNSVTRTITNISYFFLPGITWSDVSTGNIAVRYAEGGSIFDSTGIMAFGEKDELQYIIALMNSKVMMEFLKILAPSLHFNGGAINNVPLIYRKSKQNCIQLYSLKNEEIAKKDWDSLETSWDFTRHPLVPSASDLQEQLRSQFTSSRMEKFGLISWHFDKWQQECEERFNQLKDNEEELNRIFIDIYGLQDELTPEVDDKDVTVRKADLQREIKSLLSYAVGCMFGRYSLDVDGLAYAGGEWDDSKYSAFVPDTDNVIPITDEEYLEDDIVSRLCEWLKAVYGAGTLEENLDFIAQALGCKGSTSRDVIRNYFLNDFFKDHCATYSVTGSGKRPIYWLFDSGKQNGFKALVYLHRYNADTIGNVRVEYLYRMQRVYEAEIARMQDTIDHSSNNREVSLATKRKEKLQKQLKECREYDEKIGHLALSRIELDLDDGVKVNYRKVQTASDGKFYEILADSKNIMAKE